MSEFELTVKFLRKFVTVTCLCFRYGSMVKKDLRVDATLYVPQERGTFKVSF